MDKSKKGLVFGIIFSCFISYTLTMCMKMVYSASIVSIIDEYAVSYSLASLPVTLYYMVYAVIQIFLAAIMKKINMRLYMLVTFAFSGLSFISVYFYSSVWYIGTVMAVNGITLGAVWCGSVMIFAKYLTKKQMSDTLLLMGAGSIVGNVLSYGISALSMHIGNWRISFFVVGAAFLIATVYQTVVLTCVEKRKFVPEEDGDNVPVAKRIYTVKRNEAKPLIVMATIVVFFSCILYYAFTTWMPTILKDIFGVGNTQATLITMAFPVFMMVGVYLSNTLSNKVRNDFELSTVAAAIVAVLSLVLCFTFDKNLFLCVALIVILGIALRLITSLDCSYVTLHTKPYYNSGSTASIINASACVAAGGSPALIAMIIDLSGGSWQTGFIALFIAAIVLLIVPSVFWIANVKRQHMETDFTAEETEKTEDAK